jgi:hypothetical protein
VADGRFSVNLDFASQFPGADRYLEIRVRTAGSGGYTILDPRQRVRSTPYSVRSLNAATSETATNAQNLGGVAANQYVLTGDARLSDARSPLPGSGNYIQNQSAGPQPSTSFNISGNGTAGGGLSGSYVNAETDFRLGFGTILHGNGTDNWAVGFGAGQSITSGVHGTFIGRDAGWQTTIGDNNTFVGFRAGRVNISGSQNAYFGAYAGSLAIGSQNSFFGVDSGNQTTSAGANAFFGFAAGYSTTIGSANVFVGPSAGYSNVTGVANTAVGANAGVGTGNLANATAIGNRALVTQNNSLVLGSINGINGALASTNVGIGTTAPNAKLHIVGGSIFIAQPNSLIITAPNGSCWFITVSNAGALSTISVACP